MYRNKDGQPVLQGDGTYGFEVLVDGNDLVVRRARATWFGGADDPHDDGSTASGISTKGHPDLDGCALPMDGFGLKKTAGSPLPRLPWQTTVRVYAHASNQTLELPLIDVGPAKPPWAHAQIDLTQHAFTVLGGSLADGDLTVDYRVLGGVASLSDEVKAAIAALPAVDAVTGSRYPVVWLRGDYAGAQGGGSDPHHDRQHQAAEAGCALAVDFHFNSNGAGASGGEIWHKPGDDVSYRLALALKDAFTRVGLPVRGEAVLAADSDTRAGFIRHYPCPAVLLEPLFVSNPTQAAWIHNNGHLLALGEAIAAAVKAALPEGGVVGLSVGHRYRRRPGDEGADCVRGDSEADHAEELAHVVAEQLAR